MPWEIRIIRASKNKHLSLVPLNESLFRDSENEEKHLAGFVSALTHLFIHTDANHRAWGDIPCVLHPALLYP